MTMFRNRLIRSSVFCLGFFLLFHFGSHVLHAQTISGVINKYAKVLDIDTCLNQMIVEDVTGFSVGDRILIIQLKGASIDRSNTSAFGTVLNYGVAGNYEFGSIAAIQGLQITLQNKIVKLYDAASSVQIVRVPQYTDAIIGSTVTAQRWDGLRGGVVVMEASSSVALNANIDVSGQGFRGGDSSENSAAPFDTDYYNSRISSNGGDKGEGIVGATTTYQSGRGPLADGGGGGDNQNSGGGGGSNGGSGGMGGDQTELRGRFSNGGLGGRAIDYTAAAGKIFFGGGGGGGHENDSRGTSGAPGGGIVIIRTPILNGGGGKIISDGATALEAGADGAGGGGAGGTIVLDVNQINNNPTLSAQGGRGGNNNADTLPNYCYAPGGGGGGGLVVVKGPSVPPSQLGGGSSGIVTAPNLTCKGTTYGATDGSKGGGTWDNVVTDEDIQFSFPKVTTPSSTICEGDVVKLGLPGAHGIQWTPSAGLDDPTSGSPNASPSKTTHYSVSYLDSRNCAFTDTALVIVNPKPKPSIQGSINVCAGETFFDSITAIPGATYNWNVTGGTIITGQGTESIAILWGNGPLGTVEVDVTASGTSCFGKDSITVTISPVTNAILSGGGTICNGDTLVITATPGYAGYLWFPTGEMTQSINATKAGNYYVMTTSAGGCTSYSDTDTVIIRPTPIFKVIPSSASMADVGGVDTLTLDGTFVSYLWNTGSTSDTAFVTDSGTYYVDVVDTNGCKATAGIHITRGPSPSEIWLSYDTLAAAPCAGITFPLKIDTSINLPPSGATNYVAQITFDETLLVPVDKSIPSSTKGRWRTLTLQGTRPDPLVYGSLGAVQFEVALGDSVATRIRLDTFYFTNGNPVIVHVKSGMFKLTNLCQQGGVRLFSETDSLLLNQNIPNPARTTTSIIYSLMEDGNTKLWVTDELGRRAATLVDDFVKAGKYSVQLNTTGLTTGNYFYILQTPTAVKRRMMRIER